MNRCALVILLAGLFGALGQGQSLNYYIEVRGKVDGTLVEQRFYDDPNLKETSVSEPTGNAVARAQIAPGINKVSAHIDSLQSTDPAEILIADAWTHWTDEVTISDPNLNGTVGTFTASLRVSGSDAFSLAGGYASGDPFSYAYIYGFWDSWIGTSTDGGGSFLVGGWFGSYTSTEDGEVFYYGDDLNQPLTDVTLEFIYGQPFLLRTNMEAYIDAQNWELLDGTVEATLDFSHTAVWNGISAFYDANGNAVVPEGYSSRSGVDWRNGVVPEPTALAFLSLCLIGVVRRRS
jgi:hypothetical protein